MMEIESHEPRPPSGPPRLAIVLADGEEPMLRVGQKVQVSNRSPIGHYRVPVYLRGRSGVVRDIIDPPGIDNEEEGFGRNAGVKRHYYRVAFLMTELWPAYPGARTDELRIEVFENWLKAI